MQSGKEIYEFGPYRLEVKERRLLRNDVPVQLRAKVFDTLRVLVENHGRLVTKTDLMKAVWPDAIVEEGNLAHNLTVLRKALGEKETGYQHVETVPGQGYRFIADVRLLSGEAAPPMSWDERLDSVRAQLASTQTDPSIEGTLRGHPVGRARELALLVSG